MQRTDLLRVQHDVRKDAVVVTARGDLDLLTTPRLTEEITTACGAVEPPTPVVVDLREVTFLGSAAVGGLVRAHQECTDAGAPLRVVADNRIVLRPLKVFGLEATFDIAGDVETAISAGRSGRSTREN